jgi:hypothetical protein
VALEPERRLERFPNIGVVVDDEDAPGQRPLGRVCRCRRLKRLALHRVQGTSASFENHRLFSRMASRVATML